MRIRFDTPKHERLANDANLLDVWCAKKALCIGDDVILALDTLAAADSLYDIPRAPWHPHPLSGTYKGCFAIRVNQKSRIVFRPDHENNEDFRIDNFKTIKQVAIVELCIDYHGH
jgi:plasmid maintenance system killer protein